MISWGYNIKPKREVIKQTEKLGKGFSFSFNFQFAICDLLFESDLAHLNVIKIRLAYA